MLEKPAYEELAQRVRELEAAEAEWKKTEAALRESRAKYRTLFESANDAIFIASAQTGILLDANQQAERITGRSRTEIIGQHFTELHPRKYQARAKANFENDFKRKGKQVYQDFAVQHSDGRKIPVQISPSLIEIQGEPCLLGIFRDVSEQKKAEKALIESENRYRSIFRNRHVVMLIIDPDSGDIRDANPAAVVYYGWSYEELTGMNIKQINTLAPEEVEKEMRAADQMGRNHFHFRHRLKNGVVRDVEVSSGPVEFGEKRFLCSIVRDITEQKRAEQALRESEASLKKSQEIAKLGSYQTDLKENHWTASDEFYRIFGLPKKEKYTQEEFQALVHPDDFDDVMAHFHACLREQKPFNYQYRCIKQDTGDVIYVQSTSDIMFHHDGTPEKMFGIKQDITDRKKAELSLQESQSRFRLIFEQSTAGIAIASADGRFIDANQAICDMLGYTRAELLLMTVLDVTQPDDRELSFQRDRPVLNGKQDAYRLEKRFRHKAGHTVWADLSSNVIRDDIGNIRYAIGVVVDITRRKQAEEELKTSERKFRNIAESIPGLVLKYKVNPDKSDELLYISKGVEDIYGIPQDKAADAVRLLWERVHPDDLQALTESVKRSAETLSFWETEFRVALPDGKTKWLHSRGLPTKQDDGGVVWDSLGIDITDRKRAEAKLTESEARFRAIFEQAAAGIAVASIPSAEIIDTNQALCDMLGYTREELCRLTVTDITYPEDWEEEFSRAQPILDGKQDTFNLEKRYRHKNGDLVWAYLWSTVVRDENGSIQYAIGVVVNITERKRAEAALQKSLTEKEVLLREIHHRVKNNMQAISGLLRMHARRTEDAHLTEIFNDCRDRIGAMSLVHEALYQSENLSKIDFEAYLGQLCRNLGQAHDARGKGITLTASAADVSLNMDQGIAVGMIIAELISNAFKHAFPNDEGGAVSVHLDRADGGTVRLVVSDTGKGLPPDFDIRNPPSLGLRLVSGAVTRELGGSLAVEKDNGARFIIRFKCDNH